MTKAAEPNSCIALHHNRTSQERVKLFEASVLTNAQVDPTEDQVVDLTASRAYSRSIDDGFWLWND